MTVAATNNEIIALIGAFASEQKAVQWLADCAGWKTNLVARAAFNQFLVPRNATAFVDSLSAQAQVILALQCEAGGTLAESVMLLEAERLLGEEGMLRGIEEIDRRRIFFSLKLSSYDPRGKIVALPEALRKWLAPELSGLINAATARKAQDADEPPGAAFEASLVKAMCALCAVAQLRPRITEHRLYKRDGEKMAELLGFKLPAQADAALAACFSLGLLRGSHEGGVARALPNWGNARKFVALLPHERAERALGTYGWGPTMRTVLGRRGGWVSDTQLSREARLAFAGANSMAPLPKDVSQLSKLLDNHYRAVKSALIANEHFESATFDGEEFFRLKPEFAAGFRGHFPEPAPVFVQPNFEVIVPKEAAPEALLLFAQSCELKKCDTVITFAFTQASVQRAALEGINADEITAGAARFCAHGVPDNVIRSIADWAGNSGRVTVQTLCFIEVDDGSLTERVVASLGAKARQVGPRALVAANEDAKAVVAVLEKHGLKPRNLAPDDADDDVSDALPDGPPLAVFAPTLGLALPPGRIEKMRQALGGLSHPGRVFGAKSSPVRPVRPVREPPTADNPRGILKLLVMARDIDCAAGIDVEGRINRVLVGRVVDVSADGFGEPATVRIYDESTKTDQRHGLGSVKKVTLHLQSARRLSRNAPCPCGSNQKYKRCCSPGASN